MKLVVVESPNKVKKISSFLGDGYKVGASVGHIRDLPATGDLGVSFADGHIDPHYIITKKDRAKQLQQLAQGADEVLIATDPDREGEAIGWHIIQILGEKKYTYKRVTFNQITKKAVLAAVNSPGELDMNLVNAQQARRVFDRVVGWVVSPTLRRGLGKKDARSAGRVQSTALRLVVERELAIRQFDVRDYFELEARLSASNPPAFSATLYEWQGKKLEHRLRSSNDAQALADACQPGPWTVKNVDRKESRKFAPPPFTTSTVQQAASVRLKLSPDQCMKALQSLFEAGHITYHRTDSVSLSPEAIETSRTIIGDTYGKEYVPASANKHSSKVANAQEAHEAIRPTHAEKGPKSAAIQDHQAVYELIWQRYIASQMAAGVDDVTVYTVLTASEENVSFRARGVVRLFDGWRKVSEDSTSEKKKDEKESAPLPTLQQGDALKLDELKLNKKSTKPPPRYTQAALIKEMEKQGIGRPSTYASIMKTIMDRKYVNEVKRKLHASDLGIDVCQWLIEHYKGNFIEMAYTSGMEERLDAMSRGELDWHQAITEESELLVSISQKAGLSYNPLSGEQAQRSQPVEGIQCPSCKGAMRLINSSNGEFYGCMDYPKCKGTRPGKEQAEAEKNAPQCPLCEGTMRYRKSKHGAFWGCAAYPKCKGLRDGDGQDKSQKNSGKPSAHAKGKQTTQASNEPSPDCPQCQSAMRLVPEKPGRYQAFWSCTTYPKCKGTQKYQDSSNQQSTQKPKKMSDETQSKDQASSPKANSNTQGTAKSCPDCGSEMFYVPERDGLLAHYSCRYAPDCEGKIEAS
ncbi:MAG: type I DNA topoisomerase [Planctomycetes bacterium]|nr:type I DNA topoisomerase [Planctomycetota bacterium]